MKTQTAKHTPGPWIYKNNYSPEVSFEVMTQDEHWNLARVKTSEANARLIAAAPELLEAAKRWDAALPVFEDEVSEGSLRAQLRAAIAKAEGRS